jgi:lysosomal acid lipase/cholesteryl ester hydrolase
MLPILMGHEPGAVTSTRTVIHVLQLVNNGKFQKFDHGPKDNLKFYNQRNPPDYEFSKVDVPVVLMWSDNDWLSHPIDIARMELELPRVIESYKVPLKDFNHADFVFGIDADILVYQKIFKLLQDFQNNFNDNIN